MEDVRIGILGAGRMGEIFAHHLSHGIPSARVMAIADVHVEKANHLAQRFNIPASLQRPDDLLKMDEIDAVIIATPTDTHSALVQAAAQAGKHIFCEKPLALSLQECDAALAAVQEANVLLQVGFMRRFDAPYAEAKKMIERGDIGEPVMFKASSRDPQRPPLEYAKRKKSGGLIIDMGVHDFDLARWLLNSEVHRVYTEGGCLAFPELQQVGDIDNAVVNLRFESGAIGNIDMSRNAVYGYDIRAEILGTEGGILVGQLQQTPMLQLTRKGVLHDTYPFFMERFASAYAAEIRHFVECILEQRNPWVTGEDGRQAVLIGLAATLSLDEGRPVRVSELASI